MSQPAPQTLTIDDLSKGLNTFDTATRVGQGYYVDAQNMTLTNKTPETVGGLTRFNATPAPNSEAIVWFEPYTTGAGATTMLVATGAGTLYRYTLSTDLWETLLKGLSTSSIIWSHVPFRGNLLFSNGSDRPFKYEGTNVLPIGGLLVADMESDETWAGGSNTTVPSLVQEGLAARIVTSPNTASLTYSPVKDFLTGINGAPNFAATDLFEIEVFKAADSPNGSVKFRFGNVADTAYFESTVQTVSTTGWSRISLARSTFATTGAPVWNIIAKFSIIVSGGDSNVYDNAFWRYALSPPVGSLLEMYAQQLVVAGISTDRVALQYSDAGTVDSFPAVNIARFSGGRHALEKTDQITALRSYFDELIVGKVNSAWTFSGTGTNVSISALPLTIGIDAHRGIAETPWSLHYLFENNIFGARLTSRGLVSTNVNPLLIDIDGASVANTVTIRHDRSHTIRWSFRTTAATLSQNDLGLLYEYQLDAWASRYTPKIRYYTRAIVNGNREILAAQYDGYMRRVDVGTDFDGTPIESSITLPYYQTTTAEKQGHVSRWINGTFYLSGTANVLVEARFADEPHTFDTAAFSTFGTIQATPDGDKGFVYFGPTSRWIQVRLRATSGAFEVLLPIVIGYADTDRRV